jgi:hypothetical protein
MSGEAKKLQPQQNLPKQNISREKYYGLQWDHNFLGLPTMG